MSIILRIYFCILIFSFSVISYGQYGNRFVIGFSTGGFYIADYLEMNNPKKQVYVEVLPSIGFRVSDQVYVYGEIGRSFSNSKGYPDIPRYNFAGSYVRWYMIKDHFLDIYSGAGIFVSDLEYQNHGTIKSQSLSNVRYAIYSGFSFRLFKGLHIATDIGYRYQIGINSLFHSKISLQYGF